jgi:hypothetical protein
VGPKVSNPDSSVATPSPLSLLLVILRTVIGVSLHAFISLTLLPNACPPYTSRSIFLTQRHRRNCRTLCDTDWFTAPNTVRASVGSASIFRWLFLNTLNLYNFLPPLWSSDQSSWLLTQRSRVRSIPSATRFSEWQWVWNAVHSALVRINEELHERKVAAPV